MSKDVTQFGVDGTEKVPTMERGDFVRLTENGRGINLWGYITDDDLKDVLRPGYFDSMAGGVDRLDRIELTATSEGGLVHGRLVVIESRIVPPTVLVERLE